MELSKKSLEIPSQSCNVKLQVAPFHSHKDQGDAIVSQRRYIICAKNSNYLIDLTSELISKCRHINGYVLHNIK